MRIVFQHKDTVILRNAEMLIKFSQCHSVSLCLCVLPSFSGKDENKKGHVIHVLLLGWWLFKSDYNSF